MCCLLMAKDPAHHDESWSVVRLLSAALSPQFVFDIGLGGALPAIIDCICSKTQATFAVSLQTLSFTAANKAGAMRL